MVTARGSCDARALSQPSPAAPVRVPPPRTLLGNVNSHLICVLCRGYYIDATTIVECLHTFCRSCIVKHLRVKSYCPVCEMMINSAKPNIKLDKALQDIVYKLVPGLFQREMARRREFYASRPELAADVTPEQRGEDTERIVFSPDDVISFSLEYADFADDAVSTGSSESGNEAPASETPGGPARRYLRCPAVVNISHLKKFLSLKFDIDVAHFFVDILYKRVPLPDYYTLMDIAYIYNWKRIEPMRFFYQITDFTAIRDRFGFMELGNPAGGGRGRGPARLNEPPPSDASSGSSSPAPDDALSCSKSRDRFTESDNKNKPKDDDVAAADRSNSSKLSSRLDNQMKPPPPADVEKSQFLNSFELTAKCSMTPEKSSPQKEEPKNEKPKPIPEDIKPKLTSVPSESSSSTKRKSAPGPEPSVEIKKIKGEESASKSKQDSTKSLSTDASVLETLLMRNNVQTGAPIKTEQKPVPGSLPIHKQPVNNLSTNSSHGSKLNVSDVQSGNSKPKKLLSMQTNSQNKPDINSIAKKCQNSILKNLSLKRKLGSAEGVSSQPSSEIVQIPPKLTTEAAKERQSINTNKSDQKQLPPQNANEKNSPITKNICVTKPNMLSPTVNIKSDSIVKIPNLKEASKGISSQPKKEGDPLRSLFNSCNISIPSSLSITLTDQKLEEKQESLPEEPKKIETKKVIPPTTNPISNNPAMQISTEPIITPPDKNYLEIIKLPDVETPTNTSESTSNSNKPTNPSNKPLEPVMSAKGPVPNLKPISEANFSKPQTFQQTFLQSLQQHKEKPKFNKTRLVLPKFKPTTATPEEPSEPKSGSSLLKPPSIQKLKFPISIKPDSALDLSTPHTVQSQLGPRQAKALETMQTIAKLAKTQCAHQRLSTTFSSDAFKAKPSTSSALRVPMTSNNGQLKINTPQNQTNSPKHFPEYFQPIKTNINSPNDGNSAQTSKAPQTTPPPYPQTSERSQTRSPSSSPKLVIACPSPKSQSPEQKQYIPPKSTENNPQTNLISSSSQISSTNTSSSEISSFKDASKIMKPTKPPPINRLNTIKGNSSNSNNKSSSPNIALSGDIIRNMAPQIIAQQAYLRQQLELQTTYGLLPPGAASNWLNSPFARAHFEKLVKNLSDNNQIPFTNSHNSKEKP